jgi:hypothetical protein
MSDFYVGDNGSETFGARLLADYTVGGTSLDRSRQQPAAGLRFLPLSTRYGLRKITLPVHVFGVTPRHAGEQKSKLDAALLADPVELRLPDGFCYTASLDTIGEVSEVTGDGCILEGSYTLSGFRHDPIQKVSIPPGGGSFQARGSAPDMECRLTCTVGADATSYIMAGILWVDVSAGDVLVLDGIEHQVLRNGTPALAQCDLTQWPLLAAGKNILTAPDALLVEYYPIWI